mmetsp:Transcript_48229/g.143982  ORF Transcript_48229/g.143982 Transcript_48229/m.143982 type:complete len:203 (-) Transcript_48229:727-1335(-)
MSPPTRLGRAELRRPLPATAPPISAGCQRRLSPGSSAREERRCCRLRGRWAPPAAWGCRPSPAFLGTSRRRGATPAWPRGSHSRSRGSLGCPGAILAAPSLPTQRLSRRPGAAVGGGTWARRAARRAAAPAVGRPGRRTREREAAEAEGEEAEPLQRQGSCSRTPHLKRLWRPRCPPSALPREPRPQSCCGTSRTVTPRACC